MFKNVTLSLVTILCLSLLAACSGSETPQMANEMSFPLEGITSLTISYDEEDITFFESGDDSLTVKEYMTKNKRDYYARVDEGSGSIQISEGDKPLGGGFTRYVEVYLPKGYDQSLTVTSTNGKVDFSGVSLNLGELRVDNTSGTTTIADATAPTIHLSSTSGTTTCAMLSGTVTYESTSGDLTVESAVGGGSYRANNSGKLDVTYTEVSGDLSLYNKNDGVSLTLPEGLAFTFRATTKNGAVNTDFPETLTMDERTVNGDVGENPTVTVSVETNDGDIEVRRG